jgi:Ring finger domain
MFVQWIDQWFTRHFGESFILSRIHSDDFYHFLFSKSLNNKDPTSEPCYICLEDIDTYIVLPCTHRVHASCLAIWMDVSNRCPNCRHFIH